MPPSAVLQTEGGHKNSAALLPAKRLIGFFWFELTVPFSGYSLGNVFFHIILCGNLLYRRIAGELRQLFDPPLFAPIIARIRFRLYIPPAPSADKASAISSLISDRLSKSIQLKSDTSLTVPNDDF